MISNSEPRNYLCIGGLLTVAIVIYAVYGLDRMLLKDNAIYYYSAQQLCRGVPPYESIFDIKTPLTTFFSAIGVCSARAFSLSELTVMRASVIPIGLATVCAIFLLGVKLWRSHSVGVFAALSYLAFQGATLQTVAGPRPKILMLFFETLALLVVTQKRFFLFGVLSSLAALTWQPAAVIVLGGLGWAARSPNGRKAVARVSLGAAIPGLLIALYFWRAGALRPLLDGALLIHLKYFDHGVALPTRLTDIGKALVAGFPYMALPVSLGIALFAVRGIQLFRGKHLLSDGHDLPVFLVFGLFVLWSLFDFQGYPDWFPLLPFAALGFGRLLAWAATRLTASAQPGRLRAVLPHYFVAAVLCFDGLLVAWQARQQPGVDAQYAEVRQVLEKYRPGTSIVALDAPGFLALGNLTNPSPHIVIDAGIDRYMDERLPGGIAGWVDALDRTKPDIIVVGRPRGQLLGPMRKWIKRHRAAEKVGPWTVWR